MLWLRFALLAATVLAAGAPAGAAGSLAERVERAASDLARARVPVPDRFEVIRASFGGADPVPSGAEPALEPLEVEGPNASGVVRLRFRLLADGVPCGEARATVRGTVRGPALVAASTLRRGEAIAERSVRVADADLTRLPEPPLRDASEVVGRVPVRTLGPGRVLRAALVEPAPVVRRGERVDLRVEGARLTVRAEATVLRDGAPGDVVPAENTASGTVVMGEVLSDGSLRLVRRAHGRSR